MRNAVHGILQYVSLCLARRRLPVFQQNERTQGLLATVCSKVRLNRKKKKKKCKGRIEDRSVSRGWI